MQLQCPGLSVRYNNVAEETRPCAGNQNYLFSVREFSQIERIIQPYVAAGFLQGLVQEEHRKDCHILRSYTADGQMKFFISRFADQKGEESYGIGIMAARAYEMGHTFPDIRRILRNHLQVSFPETSPAFSLV